MRPGSAGRNRPAPDPRRRLKGELLGGTAFVLLGALIGLPAVIGTLDCQRFPPGTRPSCRLQWLILFGWLPIRDTTIESLDSAHAVERRASRSGSSGRENVYEQVTLYGSGGEYILNAAGEAEPARAAAKRIQAFLATPDQAVLHVEVHPTGLYKWLRRAGDVLILFGVSYWLVVPLRILQIARPRFAAKREYDASS